MSNDFFVDADGLDGGRNGYREKASELETLVQRIASLSSQGRVYSATGNDKDGKAFAETHLKAVGEIHDGIKIWAKAVDGTADAIGDMSGSFREVDEGAMDMSRDLRKSFIQLNEDITKSS